MALALALHIVGIQPMGLYMIVYALFMLSEPSHFDLLNKKCENKAWLKKMKMYSASKS